MKTCLLLTLSCIFLNIPVSTAQLKSVPKCVKNDWADNLSTVVKCNILLDSACKTINNAKSSAEFEFAYSVLYEAYKCDSVSSGTGGIEYYATQLRKIKRHIADLKESGSQEKTEVSSTQPAAAKPEEKKMAEQKTVKSTESGKNAIDNKTANAGGKSIPETKKPETVTAVIKDKPKPEESKMAVDSSKTTTNDKAIQASPANKNTEEKKNTVAAKEEPVVATTTTPAKSSFETVKPATPEKTQSNGNVAASQHETKPKEVKDIVPQSPPVTVPEKPRPEIKENKSPAEKILSEEEQYEYQAKGMAKIKELEGYIKQVSNKNTSAVIASGAVENALKLFYDAEERWVQVSSINNPDKPKFRVRNYMSRLRLLNYDHVDIEWVNFQYTSDFIKGDDGLYHGYIEFQQRFTATKDNRIIYSDLTTKKEEVILKPYKKAFEGEAIEGWDVFLGDMSVVQTERN